MKLWIDGGRRIDFSDPVVITMTCIFGTAVFLVWMVIGIIDASEADKEQEKENGKEVGKSKGSLFARSSSKKRRFFSRFASRARSRRQNKAERDLEKGIPEEEAPACREDVSEKELRIPRKPVPISKDPPPGTEGPPPSDEAPQVPPSSQPPPSPPRSMLQRCKTVWAKDSPEGFSRQATLVGDGSSSQGGEGSGSGTAMPSSGGPERHDLSDVSEMSKLHEGGRRNRPFRGRPDLL